MILGIERIILETKCVVNKMPDLLNAKTGFILTVDIPDLGYRENN